MMDGALRRQVSGLEKKSKKALWQEAIARLEALGGPQPIDEEVKETVAALNLNGIHTLASCGGHADKNFESGDTPWPWILIQAPDEPKEKFVGEREALEEEAAARHSTLQELSANEVYWDIIEKVSGNSLTPEYEAWDSKNHDLQEKISLLLDEFYQGRKADEYARLTIDEGPYPGHGGFYLTNEADKDLNDKSSNGLLSLEEQEDLLAKLPKRQQEMRDFAKFLKSKFFAT